MILLKPIPIFSILNQEYLLQCEWNVQKHEHDAYFVSNLNLIEINFVSFVNIRQWVYYHTYIHGTGFYVFLIPGRGGASIYGKEFDDEISNELKHTGIMFLNA